MKKTIFWMASVCACLVLSYNAAAASVYGLDANLSGSRTGSQLLGATGNWANASISWNITDNNDGTFAYSYTLTNFNSPPGVSHFVLDLTDHTAVTADTIKDPKLNGTAIAANKIEAKPSATIDGIFGAVKFDIGVDGTNVYTFTSNRVPVWGDFVVKGGVNGILTNAGFGNQALSDIGMYIARPDGIGTTPAPPTAIPLPGSVWMGGAGLLSLGLMQYRRRQRC